jgi:hypothetical protein
MSPKTAQLKKTSEQRCREVFEKEFQLQKGDFEALGLDDEGWPWADLFKGWRACWQYLEREVVKEFIER